MYDINWTELNWYDRYGMVWLQFIVSHHPVIRSMRLSATQCPLPPSKSRSLWGQHHLVGKIRTEQPGKPAKPGVFARGFRQNLQNLQRSQVRLQDASSRSQTFIWWFWSIKICETKLNAPKTSLRCLIRLISFDFVWFSRFVWTCQCVSFLSRA